MPIICLITSKISITFRSIIDVDLKLQGGRNPLHKKGSLGSNGYTQNVKRLEDQSL